MTDKEVDAVIARFLVSFNEMCRTERKDFLSRELTVTYETGSRIKTYQVSYRFKRKGNEWLIEAVSSGFWIFKSKFPLLRVKKGKDKMTFLGMFTAKFKPFAPAELEEQLEAYLNTCKSQPKNVFTSS